MSSNPHHSLAVWMLSQENSEPSTAREAAVEARLANAYEQRTANYIALASSRAALPVWIRQDALDNAVNRLGLDIDYEEGADE